MWPSYWAICHSFNVLLYVSFDYRKKESFTVKTTTAIILMPVFQLSSVGLAIVALICSCHFSLLDGSYPPKPYYSRSFFMHSSCNFPWLTFLPFPCYFKLHNLKYVANDVLIDYMTIHCRQFCIISLIFATTHNTNPISKNIIQHPINQSHPTGLQKLQAQFWPCT